MINTSNVKYWLKKWLKKLKNKAKAPEFGAFVLSMANELVQYPVKTQENST